MKRFTSTLPACPNVASSRSPYPSPAVSPEPVEGSNHEQNRSSFDGPVVSKRRILRQGHDKRRVDGLRMSVRQNDQSRHTRSVSEKCEHTPSRPAPPAKNGRNSQVIPREARLLGAREALLRRAPGTYFVVAVVAVAVVSAARPQYGGTLRVDTQAVVRTLDPVTATNDPAGSASRNRLLPLVFDLLFAVVLARGLQPLLARSWEGDARGTRWRFRLRSGVVLHDGHVLEPWQVATALRASGNTWNVATDG